MSKLVETFVKRDEKKFTVGDFLCQDSFTWNEKRVLRDIFGGYYSYIGTEDFYFDYDNGTWEYSSKDDVSHRHAIKILALLNENKEYLTGSEVFSNDLRFIKTLVIKYEEVDEKEWEDEFDDKLIWYEINQELLEFISKGLEQRIGKASRLTYEFVREFLETFYDYDQMLVEREFENMN